MALSFRFRGTPSSLCWYLEVMDCSDCRQSLEPYLDRELSPTEALQVRLHLEACSSCVGEYAFLSRLSRLVRFSCSADVLPPGLLPKVLSALTQA
jgi:anti-sigma factor (TIGR02949 family)